MLDNYTCCIRNEDNSFYVRLQTSHKQDILKLLLMLKTAACLKMIPKDTFLCEESKDLKHELNCMDATERKAYVW